MNREQELEAILLKTLDVLTQSVGTIMLLMAGKIVIKSAQDTEFVYQYAYTEKLGDKERITTMKFKLGETGNLELVGTDVKVNDAA